MNRKKSAATTILTAMSAVTVWAAFVTGTEPPATDVAGSFAAIAALLAVSVILKMDDILYFLGCGFVYFASPIGSVLDMYTRFGPYDKIMHFISGMLLAGFGMMMISRLLKRAFPDEEGLSTSSDEGNRKALKISRMIFAFFFSSACAGIWEIFEFTSDKLLGGGMQRGMEDTVTDIIAGNGGALLYCIVWVFGSCVYERQHRHKHLEKG